MTVVGEAAHPLAGRCVVEASSFVAAPSAGMALAQLGADVIRVDPPGGGSDFGRWPVTSSGRSLFWANLNKGKRSVTIDHRTPEGAELLVALATAPGPGHGVFLDNLVGKRRPTYEQLRGRRPDIIHAHVQGRADGTPAVDYTVNAEVGVPYLTGPPDSAAPVNHVVPAWDLLTGMTAASAVLAALLRRDQTGEGSRIDLALADVALASVSNMGWLAEAELSAMPRPRHGNHLYGSFGADFATADGRRVMVVALTQGQWHALLNATGTRAVFAALERTLDADLDDEGDRYRLRETIVGVLRPWFSQQEFATVRTTLDRAHVLWSPYLTLAEAAAAAREGGSLEIDQPGIGPVLATGSPVRWDEVSTPPVRAPAIGEHTDEVLAVSLGLSSTEIGSLHDRGIVGMERNA